MLQPRIEARLASELAANALQCMKCAAEFSDGLARTAAASTKGDKRTGESRRPVPSAQPGVQLKLGNLNEQSSISGTGNRGVPLPAAMKWANLTGDSSDRDRYCKKLFIVAFLLTRNVNINLGWIKLYCVCCTVSLFVKFVAVSFAQANYLPYKFAKIHRSGGNYNE